MKTSKNFFNLEQDYGKVFWNKIRNKALGENRISFKNQEYDIKPNIQKHFTDTKLTTKNMDDEDKSTVYNTVKNTGFYSMRHIESLNTARKRDALYNLPKGIAEFRNPALPAIEN